MKHQHGRESAGMIFIARFMNSFLHQASFATGYWCYDRHRSVRLVVLVGLAIDQIAQSGLSSLSVIYYSAHLFSSFYVKNYSLPSYTEFHGKIKSGEFDEYHVFLQKSQHLGLEISDKRFELRVTGPDHRGSKMNTRLDNSNVFIAPVSGMYKIIVKSTHRDQQCNCYVLAINFTD